MMVLQKQLHSNTIRQNIKDYINFSDSIQINKENINKIFDLDELSKLKVNLCLDIIKAAGFQKLNGTNKIRPNFQAMIDYVRTNEKDLRILWGCKRNNFEGDVLENTTLKQALMQYVNSKLETCLGVKIERFKNRGGLYKIRY